MRRRVGRYLLLLAVAASLTACGPDAGSPLSLLFGGGAAPGGSGPDPTTHAASASLWPFQWVGLLTLLVGVAWMILFRSPLVLLIGVLLGLIPFVVGFLAHSFLVPVGIGTAVLTIIAMGALLGRWLGWWDLKPLRDRAVERAREIEAQAANGATDEQRKQLLEHAERLRLMAKPISTR